MSTSDASPTVEASSTNPYQLRSLLRRPGTRLMLRRLGSAIPLLLGVSALVFILISAAPGNAARAVLGRDATEEAYRRLEESLGLDLPLYQQYARWLVHALKGDLGNSIYTGVPVTQSLNDRIGVTASLISCTIVVTLIVGVGIGIIGAVRGGLLASVLDRFALAGFAIPPFWLGALLVSWFAVQIQLLPATGYIPLGTSPVRWCESIALPVAALSLGGIALLAKHTRDAMLDSFSSEYVKSARANGVPRKSIIYKHALRNAGIRITTVTSNHIIGLLGSTVVIEKVFGLPGIGSLAVDAAGQQDLPVIEGVVIYFTLIVIAVSALTDIAYQIMGPGVSE